MKSSDDIEDVIRQANCAAPDAMRRRLWQDVANRLHQAPASGHGRLWRAIIKSHLTKLAAAAGIILVALVLWRAFGAPSKAYALSDAIGIVGRARTIHMRTVMGGGRGTREFWYDIENGRERVHNEGAYQKTYNSPDTYKVSVTTVRDGQYVMTVDHEKRTVRFERLLSWERELYRLEMADLAMNTVLPGVLRHLNQYTKIGKGQIGGQSYDIWRREWRETELDTHWRYDIWHSPTSGEIGRTRAWVTNRYGDNVEWKLTSETDKIDINREPPAGTFTTEPPDGCVLKNSKATADILRTDFLLHRNHEQGYELYALPGFLLEDGSVVAIWTVANGPAQPDPNAAYEGLNLGGPLPEMPLTLLGLWFVPAGGERYGSVFYRDESTPITLVDAVGRHLMATRKANRVYEWALYVPQDMISSHGPKKETITITNDTKGPVGMRLNSLNSLAVTRERFAQYLTDALRELSETPGVPAFMTYENLLNLAAQIRSKRDLYEAFAEQTREVREENIGLPEPVEVTPLDESK